MKKLLPFILAGFLSTGAIESLAISNQDNPNLIETPTDPPSNNIVALSTLNASAQNYSTWLHHGNYPLSQCYDIIEMSDGNLVVKEAVFDDDLYDIGLNLYKITPDGVLLDSLFVEDHYISSLSPMLRDPASSNSNVVTSFYTDDNDNNYYKAVYFTDNLEITNELVVELPEDCPLPGRFIIDSNNDMICRARINSSTFRFLRIGLDGSVKKMSEPMVVSSGVNFYEHPLFVLSTEPLRYGYVTYGPDIIVEIYDEDFVPLSKTIIRNFDGWVMNGGGNYNVAGNGDGYYFITIPVFRQGNEGLMVVKINSDNEIVSTFLWGENAVDGYPRSSLVNKNLVVTENGVYVVWTLKKIVDSGNGSKTSLIVTRFDIDLTLSWEEYTLDVFNGGLFGNYGLTSLSNGGVALSGWLTVDNSGYYESKDIYAVVFDNYLSTDELSSSEKPFLCYPNPAKDIVSISFAENSTCQEVNIYSLDGRLVETCHGASLQQTTVNVENLNAGVYILKIRMADGSVFAERIVKE